jgi:hypothetical protein
MYVIAGTFAVLCAQRYRDPIRITLNHPAQRRLITGVDRSNADVVRAQNDTVNTTSLNAVAGHVCTRSANLLQAEDLVSGERPSTCNRAQEPGRGRPGEGEMKRWD